MDVISDLWPLFSVVFLIIIVPLLVKSIFLYKKKKRLKNAGVREIENMDGFQFESYLAELFKENGYKVKMTRSRGDFGADLLLSKDHKKIAVQAKRYAKPVGIKAVQEVIASIPYYQTNEGWVVSTNSFTKSAKELAASAKNIELVDKDQLVNMVLKMNPDAYKVAEKTLRDVKPQKIRCPTCGGSMSVKKSKYGRFYGCDSYPRCKTTKKLGSR
ncbi:restriction endonuclease [Paraliobacillus ryukyuensis]|uniref:restriction endonuclease n=1 Tax=Paraliobacillus ryukyuensis TaxID=200904 RepID=UPI0009A77AC5|nr:restriction endonuclease [Paraliobacillus ryukyuensis]